MNREEYEITFQGGETTIINNIARWHFPHNHAHKYHSIDPSYGRNEITIDGEEILTVMDRTANGELIVQRNSDDTYRLIPNWDYHFAPVTRRFLDKEISNGVGIVWGEIDPIDLVSAHPGARIVEIGTWKTYSVCRECDQRQWDLRSVHGETFNFETAKGDKIKTVSYATGSRLQRRELNTLILPALMNNTFPQVCLRDEEGWHITIDARTLTTSYALKDDVSQLVDDHFRRKNRKRLRSSEQYLYRFFDAAGELLYIGIAQNFLTRWKQHKIDKHWFPEVATFTVEKHPDRASVETAERDSILSERPRYNVVHNRMEAAA